MKRDRILEKELELALKRIEELEKQKQEAQKEKEPFTIGSLKRYIKEYFSMIYKINLK